MRIVILSVATLLSVACNNRQNLQCEGQSSCDLSGGGMCLSASSGNMWCAYPDPECPSGYRYSSQDIGDGLSGMCVPDGNTIDAGVDTKPNPDADLPVADWATRYGGPGDDSGTAIAVAANGDLVMVGNFNGTMNVGGAALSSAGQTDIWVARYKADGTHIWSTKLGGIGADSGFGVAVDGSNDVYVVGQFVGPVNFGGGSRTNAYGGFLVKLAANSGAYVWDRVFGASIADLTKVVTVLSSTTVAIGGRFTGTVDFGGGNVTATPTGGFDSFVAAYNISNGSPVWSKALVSTGNDGEFGAIAAVGGDAIVTAGFFGTLTLGSSTFVSNNNSEDLMVARLRGADGAYLWSFAKGGAANEYPKSIGTDGTHVFVGGQFLGTTNLGGTDMPTAGSYDAFVASYNAADGTYVWSQRFGGANNDSADSIAANTTRLAVGISFSGPITIGTQALTPSSVDVAITRLNSATGMPSLAAQFGSPAFDTMALAYTSDKLAGVGTFSTSTDLFGNHLVSDGGLDIASFRVDF